MSDRNGSRKRNYGFFKVPGGWCAAAWTKKGLSGLTLPQKSRNTALKTLQKYLSKAPSRIWLGQAAAVPAGVQRATRKALEGRKISFNKFDLSLLTPYQRKILWATSRIPLGQFRTYGWTTQKAGSPGGSQAAGQALTRNPIPVLIPCHRVIASGNRLGGYGAGLEWKIRLLKCEGVEIKQGFVG